MVQCSVTFYTSDWPTFPTIASPPSEGPAAGANITTPIRSRVSTAAKRINSVLSFPDGSSFFGEVHDGKAHGRGIIYYSPDDARMSYVGDFVYGDKQGFGTMKFRNRDRYSGMWKANKAHGDGTYRSARGNKYKGDFFEGHCKGIGVLHYDDGQVYEGEMDNDLPYGEGRFKINEDCYAKGTFRNRRLWTGSIFDRNNQPIRSFIEGVESSRTALLIHLLISEITTFGLV